MILLKLIKKFKSWLYLKDISITDRTILMLESLDMRLIYNSYKTMNAISHFNYVFPNIVEYSNAVKHINRVYNTHIAIIPEQYNPPNLYYVPIKKFMLDKNGCYLNDPELLNIFIQNIIIFLKLYEVHSNEKIVDYSLNRQTVLVTKMRNNLIDMATYLYHVQQGSIYEGNEKEL